MKICAVITEYNPFHNGHAYQLAQMRALSGCEKLLCIMSGNFTQRGDMAVFDKYTRARHAVENGADAVIELPTAFAVAPAQLFARGAVHILSAIPSVSVLAFGCESGTAEDFLAAANASLREDKAFKTALKENMKDGTSYVKARTDALLALNRDIDESLFLSPNNLLGTEYCCALLAEKSAIAPLPIPRVGAGYLDGTLRGNFSSATALRSALGDSSFKTRRALKTNLPPTVYEDVRSYSPTAYKEAALCALLSAPSEQIARCPDCAEGLENRLKIMARANPTYDEAVEKVVSKRYTRARVKRIFAQNFLGLSLKDVRSYLEVPLYCRTLAVKKEGADDLLSALAEANPVVRKSDSFALKKEALACFERDLAAKELSDVLRGVRTPEYETLFL